VKRSIVKARQASADSAILIIRNERVILDADLAALYGVENRALIQAVKRNIRHFPGDFVFQMAKVEFDSLRSQIVISKGRGGRRSLPYAFTEHGAIMAANLLNSERAIQAKLLCQVRKVIWTESSTSE
jgi:hypothetical protein